MCNVPSMNSFICAVVVMRMIVYTCDILCLVLELDAQNTEHFCLFCKHRNYKRDNQASSLGRHFSLLLSLLHLVVRSPAEHRSWVQGPWSQSPAPHNRSLSSLSCSPDGGGKTTTKRTFLFWLDTGMSVCRCGFVWLPAPGSGYSYLGSVVESTVDISIINTYTQSMNILQ